MDDDEKDLQNLTQLTNSISNQVLDFLVAPDLQIDFNNFINFDDNDEEQQSSDAESDSEDDENNLSKDLRTTMLTENESLIINSCSDPDLKKLLTLNRAKNLQLAQLHKTIRDLLVKTQSDLWGEKVKFRKGAPKPVHSAVWKLAAPYFKDKQYFSCPANADVERKRSADELTVYDLRRARKWNKLELLNLKGAIASNYNANLVMVKAKKITTLKQVLSSSDDLDKVTTREIQELQKEVEDLKEARVVEMPPLSDDELVNWDKVSEVFMKDRRSPSECQAMWRLYLHPSLNNSAWSPEENSNLERIARAHSLQDWESISEELGSHRSAFATCLHYFTNICDKLKKNKFSPDEDKLLTEIIDYYKIGNHVPWRKVAHHFNNRSRHQLYHRYKYFLSQSHVKKGRFSEAEDILLMILVDKFGKDFKKCAELMPHRSQMQLKGRYGASLERRIKKGTFTQRDDEQIFNHVAEHGEGSWGQLILKLGRCRGQIRQRYLTIKGFLANHPNTTIKDIPRRKHAYKGDERYNFLTFMVNQFKNCEIPTISMIEDALEVKSKTEIPKMKQIGRKPNNDQTSSPTVKTIDSMLVDFFSTSLKVNHQKCVTSRHLDEAASNVSEILTILGAKLEIPKYFQEDPRLDDVDTAILGKIFNNPTTNNEITSFVPPNINTLVGLRSLLIKHKNSKKPPKKSESTRVDGMEENLPIFDFASKSDVLADRELFSQRFNALFHWSSILSLEKPNSFDNEEEPSTSGAITSRQIEQVKPLKTFSRRTKTEVKPIEIKPSRSSKRNGDVTEPYAVKKRKVEITLKPVDRSVVEKLKKQKQINITRIETVTGSDGVVRGIRDLVETKPLAEEDSVAEGENLDLEKTSEEAENEDLEDLRKLDLFMKTEIEEQKPSCSNRGEYEALQDDIQLLDELLAYDSIKC